MAQVTSIVMQLDNGMYRSIDVARVLSAYVHGNPPSNATLHRTGTGGLVSEETKEPDWEWPSGSETSGDGDGEDNGNGPVCYLVDGVWFCD